MKHASFYVPQSQNEIIGLSIKNPDLYYVANYSYSGDTVKQVMTVKTEILAKINANTLSNARIYCNGEIITY